MGYFRKFTLKAFALFAFAFFFAGCQMVSFEVVVKSSDGALLNNATVHLDDKRTLTTNEKGVADLSIRTRGQKEMVIRAVKEGFITQSIVVPLESRQTEVRAQLILKPAAQAMQVENVQNAQTIKSEALGAKVVLPENALVKPNGEVAQGEVTFYLTPWDITTDDLLAMPGNAQAIDANGERVSIISAGMMSVDFYDEAGNYLQLAPGAKATIQMDLMRESVNNIPLNPGSQIPMWHFDENKGLWIEDGIGSVVADNDSPLGMAVSAQVAHFSTWNWDFTFNNPGSVDVQCRLYDGTPTPCNIIAKVTLDDGSNFTHSKSIPKEGTTIIYMPTNATIEWTGTTATGLIGHETSGSFGTVIITLEEPTTDNFVQCQLPDGSFAACKAILENPNGNDLKLTIPADGATIQTALKASSLSWSAKSYAKIENDEVAYYTGDTTSQINGNVIIPLDNRVVIGEATENTFYVTCTNPNNYQVSSCDIRVGYYNLTNWNETVLLEQTVPVGETTVITMPKGLDPDLAIYFRASAITENYYYDAYDSFNYVDLVTGEYGNNIELPLEELLAG